MKYKTHRIARAEKRKKFSLKNIFYAFIILFFIAILAMTAIYLYSYRSKIENYFSQNFIKIARASGFIIKDIYIDGCVNLVPQTLLLDLAIKPGDVIVKMSSWEIKEKLEKHEWIRSAVVDRKLPNNLYIGIRERKPIAIKQFNRKLQLIDEDGQVFNSSEIGKFVKLPMFVGEDVEDYVLWMIKILKSDPELYGKIDSVSRIGNRRWDVILVNKTIIKLPEVNIEQAWEKFSKMNKNREIDIDSIKIVDLRVERKIFLEKIVK